VKELVRPFVVSSAKLVRRRQSAGVGVGAFGCRSTSAEETRAARTRGSPRNQGKSLLYFFFIWVLVCVCVVRPRPAK